MKSHKIIGLLLLCLSFSIARAGHEKGGIILTYKSVAGITGNPMAYLVTGYAMIENGFVPPPSSININITSSCYPSMTRTLFQSSVGAASSYSDYCVPGANISATTLLAVYHDTVLLPGTCSDYVFSSTGISGRYSNTDNIIGFSSLSPYFYATLDNTLGTNSTPEADVADFIQAACLGYPLSLYGFSESDNDSIHYTPSAPAGIGTGGVSDISYQPGYSAANPVGTSFGYQLDAATGTVQTQLDGIGVFLVTIKYEEFRMDPATFAYVKISEGRFMMLLIGSGGCTSEKFEIAHVDQPNADVVACGDSSLQFATSRRINTGSLSSNGSEFTVSTNSGNIPVSSATALSDSLVEIKLAQPIPGGAVLALTANTGSDGNVILSYCGRDLTAFQDTVHYFATSGSSVSATFAYTANFLDVNFNSSGSTGDSLVWDFGDGGPQLSGVPNPSHSYATPGQYTVSLISFNDCSESDTAVQMIDVCDSLAANFTYSFVDDSVHFDASGSIGADIYMWDFGDGNSGNGSNTAHHYDSSGTFVVQLSVANSCGDTAIFRDTLDACEEPVPAWTYTVVSTSGNGMVVDFDGTASRHVESFEWDFGDGTTNSTSLTPTHTFATPGLHHYVSLSVTNFCGQTASYGYRLEEIGIQEWSVRPSLMLFPNPVESRVTVKAEQDIRLVEIAALTGKNIYRAEYGNRRRHLEIDVENLPRGLYIISVKLNDGTTSAQKLRIE